LHGFETQKNNLIKHEFGLRLNTKVIVIVNRKGKKEILESLLIDKNQKLPMPKIRIGAKPGHICIYTCVRGRHCSLSEAHVEPENGINICINLIKIKIKILQNRKLKQQVYVCMCVYVYVYVHIQCTGMYV
jgi:hypothetical protein